MSSASRRAPQARTEAARATLIPPRLSLAPDHEADYPDSWPAGAPAWASGSDSGGECGVPAANLFPMPGALGNATRLYWAAAIGPIFTVHFSSELDTTPGGEQHTFVREALRGVDRRTTPWVIVGTHRPIVISSTNNASVGGDTTVAAVLRNTMAPLFADAGGAPVDLVRRDAAPQQRAATLPPIFARHPPCRARCRLPPLSRCSPGTITLISVMRASPAAAPRRAARAT